MGGDAGLDGYLLERARALSFPRYPGSEGDARAIAMVRSELAAAGLEVEEEAFSYDLRPAWWALRSVLVGSGLLVLAAGWTLAVAPRAAALLLAAALLPPGVLLAWSPWLERLYARDGPTHTANVAGRRRAKDRRLSLILMAHHDSKSQNLTLPWRMGLTLLAIGFGLSLVPLIAWVLLGEREASQHEFFARLAGSLGGAALLALSTLRNGNRSPGAVDNAGSLAILLDLARRLPPRMPPEVELLFLSPGAEEDHMVGAMRWLDRHRPECADCPVYVLNLDGGGNPGRVALLERYGFGRRFSRTLSLAARRAAARLGIPVRGVLLPPGMGIDTIPFAHRGVESITFSSGSLGAATLAVHSARDRAELLDGETLERVANLVQEVVMELVNDGSRSRWRNVESGDTQ